MKLRNANGDFISPASSRRQGLGRCFRTARQEQRSPQSKGTTAQSKKVTDKTRGFSPHAALSSMSWSYCTPYGRLAERDIIHRTIKGGLLFGGSEIFIKQQPGWSPHCLPVNKSNINNNSEKRAELNFIR